MKTKISRTIAILSTLMLIGLTTNAQDIIQMKSGKSIESKVELIKQNEVQYKKYDNLTGASYIINKSDILIIRFSNGSTEEFSSHGKEEVVVTIEQTKKNLIKLINKYAHQENTTKRKYITSFEGDYLRVIATKKHSDEPADNGTLFDFSGVYKFSGVSKRKNNTAYVNIWVPFLKKPKKGKWDKIKLIWRVDGHLEAQMIFDELKIYNRLLLEKKKEQVNKF